MQLNCDKPAQNQNQQMSSYHCHYFTRVPLAHNYNFNISGPPGAEIGGPMLSLGVILSPDLGFFGAAFGLKLIGVLRYTPELKNIKKRESVPRPFWP